MEEDDNWKYLQDPLSEGDQANCKYDHGVLSSISIIRQGKTDIRMENEQEEYPTPANLISQGVSNQGWDKDCQPLIGV